MKSPCVLIAKVRGLAANTVSAAFRPSSSAKNGSTCSTTISSTTSVNPNSAYIEVGSVVVFQMFTWLLFVSALHSLALAAIMEAPSSGFYGEINVLIFMKRLNGNSDLVLSSEALYEFYLYLDSLEASLKGNANHFEVIQSIFNKVYSESELFMSNTISIGNHMSLSLSSEYGVTLFEALCCTMKSLSLKIMKLRVLINNDHDDEDTVSCSGSVVVHDLSEDEQYHINCALILWDIIKLLLSYNIRIYHRESHFERISYYTITILYQSFLILFDEDPFRGDIIDRYMALILNSINCDAMKLRDANDLGITSSPHITNGKYSNSMNAINSTNSPGQHRNGLNGVLRSQSKRRRSINCEHPNHSLDIEYFMPSILTITGDPDIVLCDFWFGGAFPTKSERNISDDTLEQHHRLRNGMTVSPSSSHKDEGGSGDAVDDYDGSPSPEMVMGLWFRFVIVSFVCYFAILLFCYLLRHGA